MNRDLAERIRSPHPKKILTLDGGGIRGVITLKVLLKMEQELRRALGRGDEFVLADYFDLIAGTSTGAIIAAALAKGTPVSTLMDYYIQTGHAIFKPVSLFTRFKAKYSSAAITHQLKEFFGENTPLGSSELKSVLLMVMRNVNTDQPWTVTNNPFCRFNQLDRPDCQLNLPLWRLVRASAAAPAYFPPETVRVGKHEYVFVDGSISSYTNPSFYAFMRATAHPYDLNWAAEPDKLLVVSVGTGTAPHRRKNIKAGGFNLYDAAVMVPTSLILSTVIEQDMLCRVFGDCRSAPRLDDELGDLVGSESPGGKHLLTYIRYCEELSESGLARLGLSHLVPGNLQLIDAIEYLAELEQVGDALVEKQFDISHFSGFI